MKLSAKIGGIVGALAILGAVGGVADAGASSTTVTATTAVSSHPDTASASGGACTSSANGAAWATDSYTSQLTAVSTGTNTWRVTLQDNGSFSGFADPTTCVAANSSGSLIGLYSVSVTSTGTPSQAALQSSYTTESTTQMVRDFFGDPSATVSGGDYFFSYQGGAYVQTTSTTYGDVTSPSLSALSWSNESFDGCAVQGSGSFRDAYNSGSVTASGYTLTIDDSEGNGWASDYPCRASALLTNTGSVAVPLSGMNFTGIAVTAGVTGPITLAPGQSVELGFLFAGPASAPGGITYTAVPALAS